MGYKYIYFFFLLLLLFCFQEDDDLCRGSEGRAAPTSHGRGSVVGLWSTEHWGQVWAGMGQAGGER